MKIFTVIISLTILFGATDISGENLISDDFASGYYLNVSEKNGVNAFILPKDVFTTVRRADLGDIRVFNGAGEVVPHSLRPLGVDEKKVQKSEVVPFFPLYQSTVSKNDDNLSLLVSRNNNGTIVTIAAENLPTSQKSRVTGYLLDLSRQTKNVRELRFVWKKENDSSVVKITLKESDDLQQWSFLGKRKTLLDLRYGDQRVEKRSIKLPRHPGKYVMVSWDKSGDPLRLNKVTAFSGIIESLRDRYWVSLDNPIAENGDEDLVLHYATKYRLQANSAQVSFSQPNSMARIAIQSRPDEKTSWRTRCNKVFYSLDIEGLMVKNDPCIFNQVSDRYWRANIIEDGAGIAENNRGFTLELGWNLRELLFVGRGSGPYLLAFGSGKLEGTSSDSAGDMITSALSSAGSPQDIGMAQVGDKVVLGGQKALLSPPPPHPWKKWGLWGVLILGVGVLAVMARSLAREMKVT